MGRRSHDVVMRVVAGRAVERILALGEATAPGQRRSLEADGHGVADRDGPAARTVTLGTQRDDRLSRDRRGIGDRQVRKLGGHRHQVVSTRAVTFLTTDPSIGRARAGRREHCLGVGDMTDKTAADRVVRQWLAEVFGDLGRVDGMSRGHVPARIYRAMIVRETREAALLALVIAPDQGQAAVSGAEGVIHDGAKDPALDMRFLLQLAARAPERVRDRRLEWVGDRRSRQVQSAELGVPEKGMGMPRVLL